MNMNKTFSRMNSATAPNTNRSHKNIKYDNFSTNVKTNSFENAGILGMSDYHSTSHTKNIDSFLNKRKTDHQKEYLFNGYLFQSQRENNCDRIHQSINVSEYDMAASEIKLDLINNKNEIVSKLKIIQKIQGRIDDLKTENHWKNKEIQELEVENSKIRFEIPFLEKRKSRQESESNYMKKEYAETTNEIKRMNIDIKEIKDQNMNEKVMNEEDYIEELEKEIFSLNKNIKEIQKKKDFLANAVSVMKKHNQELRIKIENENKKIRNFIKDTKNLKGKRSRSAH